MKKGDLVTIHPAWAVNELTGVVVGLAVSYEGRPIAPEDQTITIEFPNGTQTTVFRCEARLA